MSVIATYAEKKFRIVRTFELHPGRLKIAGRTSGGDRFESEVPLDSIRLPKATYWTRDFHRISLFLAPFALGLLAVAIFGEPFYKYSPLLFSASIIVCILGLVLPFLLLRRIKYYQYSTIAGVPAFDLGQPGHSEAELDAFAQLVDEQIRRLKTSGIGQST